GRQRDGGRARRALRDEPAGGLAAPRRARGRRPHRANSAGQVAQLRPAARGARRRRAVGGRAPRRLAIPLRPAGRDSRPADIGPGPDRGGLMDTTKEFTITREFDAPRATVWRAWTDPTIAAQWWHPHKVTLKDGARIDLRVGGSYAYTMVIPDGTEYPTGGEYLEVRE